MDDTDTRFSSYEREEGHDVPPTEKLYSSAGVWVGNRYANQADDPNGKYYACKVKTRTQRYDKTFDLSGYPVIGSVEEGGYVPYPDGTYQMFDMSAEKSYQSYLAGVIFRLEDSTASYVYEYDNTEGSNPDGQKYALGKWYELSSEADEATFADIVLEAENLDYTAVVLKGGSDQPAQLFRQQVLESSEFRAWMAKDDIRKRYFVNVSPPGNDYQSGVGGAVRDFVQEPFRNDPAWTLPEEWGTGAESWNDRRQVFYVYMACRSCVTRGSDPSPTINSVVDGSGKTAAEVISALEEAFADVN